MLAIFYKRQNKTERASADLHVPSVTAVTSFPLAHCAAAWGADGAPLAFPQAPGSTRSTCARRFLIRRKDRDAERCPSGNHPSTQTALRANVCGESVL